MHYRVSSPPPPLLSLSPLPEEERRKIRSRSIPQKHRDHPQRFAQVAKKTSQGDPKLTKESETPLFVGRGGTQRNRTRCDVKRSGRREKGIIVDLFSFLSFNWREEKWRRERDKKKSSKPPPSLRRRRCCACAAAVAGWCCESLCSREAVAKTWLANYLLDRKSLFLSGNFFGEIIISLEIGV